MTRAALWPGTPVTPPPGCAEAPEALIPRLSERLAQSGAEVSLGPTLRPSPKERRKEAAVSKLNAALASAVVAAMRQARVPCVIGGDHSCAGGTWVGVARMVQGELGLIWIDAHMDSHTAGTSHTGRLHGIGVPTLVLNATNDPFIPASSLPAPQDVSSAVTLELPPTGGHAGFAVGPFPGNHRWLPQRLVSFFRRGE